MGKDRTRHARKSERITSPDTEGAQGTVPGRAGTAGSAGANVPRRDRSPGRSSMSGAEADRDVALPEPEEADEENEGMGLSGSGRAASGSLPGSVGGTTGTSGENAGIASPGASVPGFPGISPEEAERLRHRQG